jgi:flagellar basal-body rod protein FlgG
MIRALYTATSGMVVESRKAELISQNLYNSQIPGYKAYRVRREAQPPTFPELPTDVQTVFQGEFIDPTAGPLRPTGKSLDLALEGDGFFALDTPRGLAYTRDGRFRRASDGVIRDWNGAALLGEDGPIVFPDDARFDAKVEVEPNGTFWIDGKDAGRLVLHHFPGFRGLRPTGGSFFFPTGTVEPQLAQTTVIQKAVEDANVSSVAEMIRMIESIRAFESYQKVILTVMEDLTGEVVRRLGRLA